MKVIHKYKWKKDVQKVYQIRTTKEGIQFLICKDYLGYPKWDRVSANDYRPYNFFVESKKALVKKFKNLVRRVSLFPIK